MESSTSIPEKVAEVLKTSSIGYLTTISKKGQLYSYPVAFYYSNDHIFFVTPVSAAKYKMIKTNPTVSMIVDNKEVTTNACGAMIQGRARIFSVTRMLLSIISVGSKVAGFSKKYPGMLSFYAKGKGLPDERKLYKYRLIQIDPVKIVYWVGYEFGRYIPRTERRRVERLSLSRENKDAQAMALLLSSADEEEEGVGRGISAQEDHDWNVTLSGAASNALLSADEKKLIAHFTSSLRSAGPKVSDPEKRLLSRWKVQN